MGDVREPRVTLTGLIGLAVVVSVLVVFCCMAWFAVQKLSSWMGIDLTSGGEPEDSATLVVAYSPEKAELFLELVENFNSAGHTSADGTPLRIRAVELSPQGMVDGAIGGEFQAVSPDSSFWLSQMDAAYADYIGHDDALLVTQQVRYAVSPVVIVMWRDEAEDMGWPRRPLGWSDLLERARSDPDFRWSHPSTSSAAGLLATLAEFYAGAGKTRDLTIYDVQDQYTLDYVAELERTVSYYGEGEWAVARQIAEQGRGYLDAFVGQEQLVIYLNRLGYDLVAVYPQEGTFWEDHPLALLDLNLTDIQRLTFRRFAEYITGPEAQQLVLEHGYRPADLTVDLEGEGSPFVGTDAVDPSQPQSVLQMPGGQVIEVVLDVWWYTKRPTDVFLVVDTSGSMEGEKLERVRDALTVFINGIRGDRDRVGLVEFYDYPVLRNQLSVLSPSQRLALQNTINSLEAGGGTALLDGVAMAYSLLQTNPDPERIHAIVVMTDGIENSSTLSFGELATRISQGNQTGVPVVIFAVAYGDDADYDTLERLVGITGGRVWEGTPANIRNLYQIISTYF